MAPCPSTTRFPLLPRRVRDRRRTPGLKRRGPRREPKRRFVLFCEGARTEPAYFDAIKRGCASTLIAVEIVGAAGVPMTIAERAVEEANANRRRRKRDSFEEDDEIWAVFDRDQHPHFKDAVQRCEQHDIGVARSDPCFELWLILHERDYDRDCNHWDVQKDFEDLRPEYDRGGSKTPDCADMVRRVEEAEKRAEAQLHLREEEDAPFGNPSTTVFRLTRAIRDADERAKPPDERAKP